MGNAFSDKAYVYDGNGRLLTTLEPGDYVGRARKNKDTEETENKLPFTVQSWTLEHFYKGNVKELKSINKELSVYESAFINYIAPYVGYEDCCLKHGNGIPLSFDNLKCICNMSRGKLSQVINQLRAKDIIYKGVNTEGIQYFVNPWLYCRGTRIQRVLKTMFQSYKIRVMDNMRWGDIPETKETE